MPLLTLGYKYIPFLFKENWTHHLNLERFIWKCSYPRLDRGIHSYLEINEKKYLLYIDTKINRQKSTGQSWFVNSIKSYLPKGSNPEKKAASFWTFSKREGGVQHESKSFGVVLFGPPFGHYRGRGEGVEPIPKVLG